jgi:hypothetical protein
LIQKRREIHLIQKRKNAFVQQDMRNTFDPKETRNTFDSKETECICPTRENTFAKSKTVKNSQKQSKNSQKTSFAKPNQVDRGAALSYHTCRPNLSRRGPPCSIAEVRGPWTILGRAKSAPGKHWVAACGRWAMIGEQ